MSLRKETRRLSRAFGAVVLALAPAAAAQACSDSSDPAAGPGGNDATADEIAADGTTEKVDGALSDRAMGVDALCNNMTTEQLEAGPDAEPDADIACRYTLPCGIQSNSGFYLVGCDFYRMDAALGCSVPPDKGCKADVYVPEPNGSLTIECLDCFGGGGRRPAGLRRPARTRSRSALGAYFARMAHDEAASVRAFATMQRDLQRFGAPAELIAAAARSERDEARHARMMARRARTFGGVVPSPRARRTGARSLEAIARENAVEGCIYETFGALQMRWQATHAEDASLRRLFSRIASDETRHAALSWLVARWVEPRLDAGARARVAAARERAVRSLRSTLDDPSRPTFDAAVGRPSRAHALALLDGMLGGRILPATNANSA